MAAATVRAARASDLPDLVRIYNHYVANTHITFDTQPFTEAQRRSWFEGFSADVKERWKGGKKTPQIRVMRVEYLIDGKVVRTLEGEPSRIWKGETFATQYAFDRPGNYIARCRVHLLPAGATRQDADTKLIAFESETFTVEDQVGDGVHVRAAEEDVHAARVVARHVTGVGADR